MGQPAACSNPDAAVAIFVEGFAVAVVPDHAVLLAIVTPLAIAKNVHAMIGAKPYPPAPIHPDEYRLIGAQPGVMGVRLKGETVALHVDFR